MFTRRRSSSVCIDWGLLCPILRPAFSPLMKPVTWPLLALQARMTMMTSCPLRPLTRVIGPVRSLRLNAVRWPSFQLRWMRSCWGFFQRLLRTWASTGHHQNSQQGFCSRVMKLAPPQRPALLSPEVQEEILWACCTLSSVDRVNCLGHTKPQPFEDAIMAHLCQMLP